MTRKNALSLYLLGCFGQILLVCVLVYILRSIGLVVDCTSGLGMIAIGLGGTSSALWGFIIAVKYKKYTPGNVLKDFFAIKQHYGGYLLALLFLLLMFSYLLFNGSLKPDPWYLPIFLFSKAIIFGGIEEIGWRYSFQPVLQERRKYITSTLITFAAWGIWHFLYFYIEGTLPQVQIFGFLIGLLTNCFVLSALYIKTKSLWICVMTHSLINVFSQLAIGGNAFVLYDCRILLIAASIYISTKASNKVAKQ